MVTARLLMLIETGQIVSAPRVARLAARMNRRLEPGPAAELMPAVLPEGAGVWGLVGRLGQANHAAWVITLPGGRRLALAIFTRLDADEPEIVREIADAILSEGFLEPQ